MIYSNIGQLVKTVALNKNTRNHQLDLTRLKAGLYFVNTNDARGEVISTNRALLFGLIF